MYPRLANDEDTDMRSSTALVFAVTCSVAFVAVAPAFRLGVTAPVVVASTPTPAPDDPASATSDTVSIYASLDLPSLRAHSGPAGTDGPRQFAAENVTIGNGPELTAANETANPSQWVGDVRVDINPVTRTITVRHDKEDCSFEVVDVRIDMPQITSIAVISDHLTQTNESVLGVTIDPTTSRLTWTAPRPGDTFLISGTSTFTYTPADNQPTTGQGAIASPALIGTLSGRQTTLVYVPSLPNASGAPADTDGSRTTSATDPAEPSSDTTPAPAVPAVPPAATPAPTQAPTTPVPTPGPDIPPPHPRIPGASTLQDQDTNVLGGAFSTIASWLAWPLGL